MLQANLISLNEKIVLQAKTWIGTRFHHQGRLKKTDSDPGGCDCVGLLVGVAMELGLQSKGLGYFHEQDIKNYSLFSGHQELVSIIDSLLYKTHDFLPGNILLIKTGVKLYHVAILSENNKIIHCSIELGCVTEEIITQNLKKRICSVYSFEK